MEVLYNVRNATQRLTRVLAERKSRRASMDIAMLSDFDMYRAYENEGLLSVDELEIPNMANVYEQFRFSYAVPHIFSSMVLVYRSEEHTSELQSLMRISYAVFCLKKKKLRQPNFV